MNVTPSLLPSHLPRHRTPTLPQDFLHIFPRERDRQTAWEALDTNKDGASWPPHILLACWE